MPDEGPDLGYCEECGEFVECKWINGAMYCLEHVPLILEPADFDMIFTKAGVDGPKRSRRWESVLGILYFSKRHHKQAAQELRSIPVHETETDHPRAARGE